MPPPLQISSLIFPSASTDINAISSALSKSALSITNRLHSIDSDSVFVTTIANQYGLPVVCNERCGSWYVDPKMKKGSAYFKSTDGHFGEWSFSLRRLNLQVLEIAGLQSRCIIVDSTRRGKHLPDALSKTIPIWCAVMNRLLFPGQTATHKLERLSVLISKSEHAQIEARLDGFVKQVETLDLNLVDLRSKIALPLKPIWIARSLNLPSPETPHPADLANEYTALYLCMASTFQDCAQDEFNTGYVQGAGDDNESWSRGLGPEVYWRHKEDLLEAAEEELPSMIAKLVEEEKNRGKTSIFECIKTAPWLQIGVIPKDARNVGEDSLLIVCAPRLDDPNDLLYVDLGKRVLHLECGPGKLGSRDLRKELIKVPAFIEAHRVQPNLTIICCCPTGKDHSVGLALALLCLYTDETGNLFQAGINEDIDKTVTRKKLSWISGTIPSASPARATLNSVNDFLMKQPR